MENTKMRPFGMRDKLAYAAGDCACNLSFAMKGYLLLFYTQYIGIKVEIWSLIILIMTIWDAINDPLVGELVESLKPGKKGKYQSWIFAGSIVLFFAGPMLFIPIKNAPDVVKIIVACVGYFLWDFGYTMANVPYGTMGAVISGDQMERSQLSTWRSIGSYIPNGIIMLIPLIVYDDNSNLLGDRVFYCALVFTIIAFILFQFMLKNTVIRVQLPESNKPKKIHYFKSLKLFFSNRNIVGAMLAGTFQIFVLNGLASINLITTQTYFNCSKYSVIGTAVQYIPLIVVLPFVGKLVKRFGKKEVSAFPALFGSLVAVLMYFIPFQQNLTGYLLWSLMFMLIYASQAVYMTVCWAMISDALDYTEWKMGERDDTASYGFYCFGRKLAQAVGSGAAGMLLLAVGYVEETAAQQTVEVATNIKKLDAGVYAICFFLIFVMLQFVYKLDKKTVAEMNEALGRNSDDAIGVMDDD